jgi:uncharacterized protein
MSAVDSPHRPAPPQPVVDPDSAGFWTAAEAQRLELTRCRECNEWQHPPLERCAACGGATSYEVCSGLGTIYSYIVVHHDTVPAFTDHLPYVLVLVELDGHCRLPGRLLDGRPDGDVIGRQVAARFVHYEGSDRPALAFQLATEP